MNTDNYFFRVPATRGIQGGIEQYMLTVPMVVLRRILAMDNDGDVMDGAPLGERRKSTSRIPSGASFASMPAYRRSGNSSAKHRRANVLPERIGYTKEIL